MRGHFLCVEASFIRNALPPYRCLIFTTGFHSDIILLYLGAISHLLQMGLCLYKQVYTMAYWDSGMSHVSAMEIPEFCSKTLK